MEEKKYINPDTITHIQNYLSIPSPPGLILAGIDGLGKKESAYYIATILLQCPHDELNSNPDFYQTKSNGALKVEDIEDLIAFTQRSSVGNRKVCLIHNASSISNITQNKLLKILEDSSEKILLYSSQTECPCCQRFSVGVFYSFSPSYRLYNAIMYERVCDRREALGISSISFVQCPLSSYREKGYRI